MARFRQLKLEVLAALGSPEWEEEIESLLALPPKHLLGPLFSCLCHPPEIKWHAVTAFGLLVSRMADQNMADAGAVMERFLWNIEKDSSITGWGILESMGEVMACQEVLAKKFHKQLISYVKSPDCPGSNYIEQPTLRRSAYWGLGRLSQVRTEFVTEAAPHLLKALPRQDATSKGLICWTLGLLQVKEAKSALEKLVNGASEIELYRDRTLGKTTLGALAKEALDAIID
jgi:hypothetical protein